MQGRPKRKDVSPNKKKGAAQDGRKRSKEDSGEFQDYIKLFEAVAIRDNTQNKPQASWEANTLNEIAITVPRQPSPTRSFLLAAELASRLAITSDPTLDLRALGNYIPQISKRIGQNAALDEAVRCLLEGHGKLLRQELRKQTRGLDRYVHALALLRRDLERLGKDPEIRTADLVCAAMVLSIYELFKFETAKAWIAHAGGVSAIIHAWGPQQIVSEFDMSLFTTHYGSIVMGSLFSGKDCFLDAPEWEAVSNRYLDQPHPPDTISFDVLRALSSLSPVLRDTRAYLAAPTTDYSILLYPDLIERAQNLRVRLMRYSDQLESDFKNPQIVSHKAPVSDQEILQRELWFCDYKVAMRYGLYWTSSIIVMRVLQRLHSVNDSTAAAVLELEEKIQSYAQNIMQSVPYLRTVAPFGALSMTFSLQVISAVVKPNSAVVWVYNALKELLAALNFDTNLNQILFCGELLTGGPIQLPFVGRDPKN